MTPAMTIGMMDFMTSSGFRTPMLATPTPALAVPYAAPMSERHSACSKWGQRQAQGKEYSQHSHFAWSKAMARW